MDHQRQFTLYLARITMNEVLNCIALNQAKLKLTLSTLEKSKTNNQTLITNIKVSIKEHDEARKVLELYWGSKNPEFNETLKT